MNDYDSITAVKEEVGIQISIIVPVYNEVNNLEALFQELSNVIASLNLSYEIIFVDDGSTDGSIEVLEKIKALDVRVVIIQFRRNFGQTAAFAAGIDYAHGDYIVTIDADGQNDPRDIPKLIEKMKPGNYDLVLGWRMNRKEPFIRRILSNVANELISRSTKVHVHDRGCSLKIMKKDLAKSLQLYGQLHRYIPELASMIGARVAEIPTIDRNRRSGVSKYGSISRTPRVVLDLFTVFFFLVYSTSPMRLFGSIGLTTFIGGGFLTSALVIAKFYYGIVGGLSAFHAYEIGNRPVFLLGIFLILIGIQFFVLGLLGEMIVRIYYEASNKPIYHIRKIVK